MKTILKIWRRMTWAELLGDTVGLLCLFAFMALLPWGLEIFFGG